MKQLTAIFFTVALLVTFGAKAQTVTLKLQKVPVQKVFKEISRQTNISIVYNEAIFKNFAPVTVDVKDAAVNDVLDLCLKDQPFNYSVDGNTIVVKKNDAVAKPTTSNAAPPAGPGVVRGIVKNERGEVLEGATVQFKAGAVKNILNNLKNTFNSSDESSSLKGNQVRSTFTNASGAFSINLPQGKYAVTVLMVGNEKYQTNINTAKDTGLMKVVLTESANTQKEVVVNGIYSRPKENYTGAATSFTGDQLREISPVSVIQALRTLDASVQVPVDNVNGSDPNATPRFQVRGTNSLAQVQGNLKDEYGYISNPPLIIVDGFETTFEKFLTIDINLIDKITILKDAAATAIYGSKSANGVLVVETKRPKPGKIQTFYIGNVTANIPDLSSYNLMNASEKLHYEEVAGYYKDRNLTRQLDLNDKYNLVRNNVQKGVNTYWLSQPLQTELNDSHTLSIATSTNTMLYQANLSYNHNGGVMKGSKRDYVSGSINTNYNDSKLRINTQLSIGSTKGVLSPYGDFGSYANLNPYWTARDAYGNISKYVDNYSLTNVNGYPVSLNSAYAPTVINPLWNATLHTINQTSNLDLGANMFAEYSFNHDLKLNGSFSYSTSSNQGDVFLPGTASDFFNQADFSKRGYYHRSNGSSKNIIGQANFNYGRIFGKHTIFATLGTSINKTSSQGYEFDVTGFANDRLDDPSFGLQYDGIKPSGSYDQQRTVGFYGNTSYAFDNRYLLDLSYRSDGSSVFGADRRFGSLWSVGAGWNVHKEHWFHSKNISRLKLRGSYGFTGSVNFPGYAAVTTYRYNAASRYLDFIPANLISAGNPDLVWQRTKKLNLGTDISLFKDIVTISFNYYQEVTDDLIMQDATAPSTGFSQYYSNLGRSQNLGIDATLSAVILKNPAKKLFWTVSTSWFHNENKLLKVTSALEAANQQALALQSKTNPDSAYHNPVLLFKEGKSISTLWAVPSLGIDPSTGREIFLTRDGKQTYIWNEADERDFGDQQPKFNITFNNHFQYKWIKLNFGLNIEIGGVAYNTTLASKYENANVANNLDKRALTGRWQKPGDVAQYTGLTDLDGYPLGSARVTGATSRFVQKKRNIQLTGLSIDPGQLLSQYVTKYTNKLVNKINGTAQKAIKDDAIDLKFYMNNVFNFFGQSKEVGTSYPLNKTYTLNLTVHF